MVNTHTLDLVHKMHIGLGTSFHLLLCLDRYTRIDYIFYKLHSFPLTFVYSYVGTKWIKFLLPPLKFILLKLEEF